MPRINTQRAHELAYRQRFSRPVRWLGCAGLLLGVLLISAPWLLRNRWQNGPAKAAGLGVLLTVAGGALVWGRRGKRFDRQAGTITFWWGAPWALARTSYDLAAFQSLAVASHEQRGRLRWRVAFLTGDGERLDLFDLCDAVSAQRAAEQIGQFLSLPVLPASEPEVSAHSAPG